MNILQTINMVANFGTVICIVFLFTCGQRFMKYWAARRRMNFKFERLVLVGIACCAMANGVLRTGAEATEVMLNVCTFAYLITITVGIEQFIRRSR